MGGDLQHSTADAKPMFLAYAARDSASGAQPLQALQLIKGWIDSSGQARNVVVPIASADGRNGDSLCTVYRDDDFDSSRSSYYYLRVVEPPTPRWSTYDCARIPEADRPAVCSDGSYPEMIQEMAWTSPIWYTP